MRGVNVIGVGMIKFGKYPEMNIDILGVEAVLRAIKDSQVAIKDVEVAYCGNALLGRCRGQKILKNVGLDGIEVVNVENACASGSTAFRGVYQTIAWGTYNIGIAIGVEQLSKRRTGLLPTHDDYEGVMGKTMPATYAMIAKRHMQEYGTTLKQLAKISVKNHKNGMLNPYAQYQVECSIEEVLNSRMICDPLTLLQCCSSGDGAAAAILCSDEIAKKYCKKPIKIRASVLKSGTFEGKYEMSASELTRIASRECYEKAGIGPEDIDVAEIHDAFTSAELYHYENLGFCEKGEGGRLIDENRTDITGDIAVNPSGGLLAKGHPLGATGIAQIAEIVWQLRGEAGKRQVEGARIGLTHTMGGGISDIEFAACAVHILTSF